MAATEEERKRFGERLRELRQERDLTAKDLASRLEDPVSHQNVTGWERGEYPPRRRAVVRELEQILEAPGELSTLLGYSTDDPDETAARLTAVESQISEIREVLEEMRQLLGDTVQGVPAPPAEGP